MKHTINDEIRNKQIRLDLLNGMSYHEVARKYGLTVNRVRRIKDDNRKNAAEWFSEGKGSQKEIYKLIVTEKLKGIKEMERLRDSFTNPRKIAQTTKIINNARISLQETYMTEPLFTSKVNELRKLKSMSEDKTN